MGEICGTYRRKEKCVKHLWERDHSEDKRVWEIILKWIYKN
jgi:hypothetical protein